MIGFIGVVASILIVLFFALFGCAACCCMCCFVPFYYLWKGNNGDTDAGKRENQTPQNTYQTVELREVHSASAPVWPEDVVADAYFVPPLVVNPVVHAVEYDNSCASQESYADHGSRVKDLWAAVVFILQTICVSSIAVYSWPYVIDKNSFDSNNSFNMRSVSLLLLAGIVLVFFSLAFAIMWINCLIKNSEFAIRTMLWVNIVVLTGASIVCLLTTQIVGVVIFGVMSILVYCFMQSVQDRIAFASSVLMVASQSVKSNNKGILALASGVAICEIFWSCIWVTAFSGVVSFFRSDLQGEEQDSNSTIRCLVFFFLFVSFFWNLQVLQNIAHVTISGTVACWWFQPKRSAPVRGSLFRALTTSFGSICFGSLIVATIQALRELRHFMREQHGVSRNRSNSNGGGANLVDCLLLVLDTVLQIIERAAVYFNRYAYCYVAAYGYDFITAGRKVTELFERRLEILILFEYQIIFLQ